VGFNVGLDVVKNIRIFTPAGSETVYPSHCIECAARKVSVYILHFKYKSNLKQFSKLGSQSEPWSRDSFSSVGQKCA